MLNKEKAKYSKGQTKLSVSLDLRSPEVDEQRKVIEKKRIVGTYKEKAQKQIYFKSLKDRVRGKEGWSDRENEETNANPLKF